MLCSFITDKDSLDIYIEALDLSEFTVSYFPSDNPEAEKAKNWQIDVYADDSEAVIKLLADVRKKFDLPEIKISTTKIEDKDWVTEVQKNFKPILVENIYIYSSYYQDSLSKHNESICINIDPGNAFGTGEHHTTKGCLRALYNLSKTTNFSNVLDLGCGSALLAIAAAKLFKNCQILATDIDIDAVKVAQENVEKNNTDKIITTAHADGIDHQSIKSKLPFDLIICNILSSVLIQIASDIDSISAEGTFIILSGLTIRQLDGVTNSYVQYGFKTLKVIHEDEWCTIIMKKSI